MSRAEGPWGEVQVANFLRRRGYDLLARQGSVLCFVEVKTRTHLSVGLPREYVTRQKQEKLRRTAACYLAARGLDCPVRFDVAEVYTDTAHSAAATRIEYLEDAF